MNPAADITTALRERHEHAVLSNSIRLEHRRGQPCRAFNLYLVLEQEAVVALGEVQRELLPLEPSLLRIPPHAMHVSVAWLIPVDQDNAPAPKDAQWALHGQRWCSEVRAALAGLAPLGLAYTSLIATDSAIIASAEPRDTINTLRSQLGKGLMLPSMNLHIATRVSELTVVREEIFPSLQTHVLDRYLCRPKIGF